MKDNGTATIRVRIKYQENTATGRQEVVSYATKGNNDRVWVLIDAYLPEKFSSSGRFQVHLGGFHCSWLIYSEEDFNEIKNKKPKNYSEK